jgi:putative transposase
MVMPRTSRAVEGGGIYHVLNRGNGRAKIFHKDEDYGAFIKLLIEAREKAEVDLFGFCLMPNHWHLVLRPRGEKDLARWMRWLSTAHVRRHHAHYHSAGGHLYQGRYKSFPVQNDEHLLRVLRYVEANALRANLASRADGWPWNSHALRRMEAGKRLLCDWPVDRPGNWVKLLEEQLPPKELLRVRSSVNRGTPYGSERWTIQAAKRLGLEFTLRPRGRPRKKVTKL